MKKLLFLVLILSINAYSQKKIVAEWQKTYGADRNEIPYSAINTTDGGYIIVGSTNSKSAFDVGDSKGYEGLGGNDFWVIKVSTKGELVWTKTFGGSKDDVATSIVKTPANNYYILGTTQSTDGDAFTNGTNGGLLLIQINEKGDALRKKVIIGGNAGSGLTYAPVSQFHKPTLGLLADNKLVIAASRKTNTAPNSQFDFYLGLFTPETDPLWSYTYGGTQDDFVHDLKILPDNSFVMCGGTFSFPNDFAGAGQGFIDMAMVKTDAKGILQWKKAWGGKSIDMLYSITATQTAIYAVGESSSVEGAFTKNLGEKDAILIKTDFTGKELLLKHIGGIDDDGLNHINIDANGNLILSGGSASVIGSLVPKGGSTDAWLISLKEIDLKENFQLFTGGADTDISRFTLPITENRFLKVSATKSADGDLKLNRGQNDIWIQFLIPPPPVLFGRFESYLTEEQKIEVVWTTTQEIGSNRFLLEKSTDGIKYTTVNEVPAAGNSLNIKTYRLLDLKTTVGKNYYKLSYTDLNEKTYIGPNLVYNFIPLNTAPWERKSKQAYPNPSLGEVFIDLDSDLASYKIFNAMGLAINVEIDTNDKSKLKMKINKSGLYFVETEDIKGSKETYKVVVL